MDEIQHTLLLDEAAAESTTTSSVRLCDMCRKDSWKYRCPRCSFRTCSLLCSKEHKAKYECSGEREKSFDVIKRLTDYSSSVAVDDEKFLKNVTTSLSSASERLTEITDPNFPGSAHQANESDSMAEVITDISTEEIPVVDVVDDEENRASGFEDNESGFSDESHDDRVVPQSQMNDKKILPVDHLEWKAIAMKRYLLNNAHRRRIWLTVTPEKKDNSSRHEQYSDTIFWTIRMIFRREEQVEEEKRIVEDGYTVNNIPESISVATLLRQFIKPRKIGPVVSKSDLDAEKMEPFQEAGMDKLMIYMPVPVDGKERFYVVDPSKSILDNTRNRFILEHPTFIVTVDNQFNDYVMLSEQEARELRELHRQKNRDQNQNIRHNNFRGRGRFDNGRFMPRSRGGGRGGFKRPYDSPDGRNGRGSGRPWKCGRSFRGGYSQKRDFCERNSNSRGMPHSSTSAPQDCDQRPPIHSQTTDAVVDAWSKALEIKSKKEGPPCVNCSSEVQTGS